MNRILLVEDEQLLAESYNIILRVEGFSVDMANNGQAALKFCQKTSYDFILLDIMMPILDGIGFLKRLNSDKYKPQEGRIIVLSNLSSDAKIKEALELGADSYVQKSSLEPAQLIELLKKEPAKL